MATRVSQLGVEYLDGSTAATRVSQLGVEFLYWAENEVDFGDLDQQSGEVIGLTWVELYHRDSSGADKTYLWAPVDLIDPASYYGGHKAGTTRPTSQTIEGLAAPFCRWCDPDFHNGESHAILPGAFTEAIARGASRLLMEGDVLELASQADGSLVLWETERGLMFRAVLKPTLLAALVAEQIAHGGIRHVCATVTGGMRGRRGNRVLVRSVERVDPNLLLEASPSFPGTSVRIVRT